MNLLGQDRSRLRAAGAQVTQLFMGSHHRLKGIEEVSPDTTHSLVYGSNITFNNCNNLDSTMYCLLKFIHNSAADVLGLPFPSHCFRKLRFG